MIRYIRTLFTVLLVFLTSYSLSSCKAKKITNTKGNIAVLSSTRIKKNTVSENISFETFKSSAKAYLQNGSKKNSLSLTVQMIKDECIWVNGTYFGFTVLRAYITPEFFKVYIKPSKQYIEVPFEEFSELLGTAITLKELQDLLVGNLSKTLKRIPFKNQINNQLYQLNYDSKKNKIGIEILINPFLFKMQEVNMRQLDSKNKLNLQYGNFDKTNFGNAPKQIKITFDNEIKHSVFEMNYKQLQFNQKVKCPFKIPSDYKKISLENLMP